MNNTNVYDTFSFIVAGKNTKNIHRDALMAFLQKMRSFARDLITLSSDFIDMFLPYQISSIELIDTLNNRYLSLIFYLKQYKFVYNYKMLIMLDR